jgi:beta-galactosidase
MKLCLPVFCLLLLTGIVFRTQGQTGTEKFSLDAGWLFYKGDIPFPALKQHGETYLAAKAGAARGAAAQEFDDSEWRTVKLPHDWAMEEGVDSTASLAQGYRKRGFGWYRRRFRLDSADKGRNLELQLEGITTHATIWVNGQEVYHSYSAYSSIYIDISAIARYGDDVNVIAVRVDAEAMEGWWYEGAGIYRHTWLVKRPQLHLATNGVFAQPIKNNSNNWIIPGEVRVQNTGAVADRAVLQMQLLDPKGKLVATRQVNISVAPLEEQTISLLLEVKDPKRWDIQQPILYTVRTVLAGNGGTDETITRCGFRTFRFSADSGFYLNDRRVKIKGVCNHIDHGGVGTAVPDALWAFRLEKIKALGANAYRCSHNAPDVKVLELCDSLGILVMDENRNFNTSPEYLAQLEWMVRRDRNHPSIILWSVFNEEPIQGTATGYEMVRRMAKVVKQLDTTRPVTAAMNGGFFGPVNVSQAVDVTGFNYESAFYDRFHQEHPQMPVTSSEDASAVMIRGEYKTNLAKHLLGSYDTEAPSWGSTHRASWKAIAERPWIAGCFVWTGFDYHGEPTPFTWPTVNSSFGIMDICGFPKAAWYLRRALWVQDSPVLHLVPHWNWPKDSMGKNIQVMVFSNADKIRLLLNGKSVGEKANDPYEMVSFQVPYQPGQLQAIAYRNGREVSRYQVATTGQPVRLRLTPYHNHLYNDGNDATPVTIEALDAQGKPVPTANLPVTLQPGSTGTLIGVANGNPNSHEPEKGQTISLYNGRAQAIVQSKAGDKGALVLTAKSPGLQEAVLTLPLLPVAPFPAIAPVPNTLFISQWRVSPVALVEPDPLVQLSDNDMNSWAFTPAGNLQQLAKGSFLIYRAQFTPYAGLQKKGGTLHLQDVTGAVTVWLDGKQVAQKTTAGKDDLYIPFAAGSGTRTLNLLFRGNGGQAGIGSKATIIP